ncbi:alpha-D-ribose 1-methylphosphonate 5-triphosphate diphosphatase [Undibacterium luofuense]|uniref:Alpha-D-ribose 1-methylphosphonate 5-triphosphate diphosphatase n=1 Tax=Undibacterium luofuense TaxID=2828733 RepID=A0A941I4Y0_9BURK|nr:alpha-D-ribose 1-methylphosphonate 5-triphosphate diphosphatase [Undibacterium luofuense]MBR7782187.1 alpha-D-ribose 1-methylphosphonate 5-triphosphate diphosphatase [Undibacterium luofuense]
MKNLSAPVFIRNARLVLHNQVLSGSLSTSHGRISSVDTGNSGTTGEDWEGDYLIPGLVEIHTDNLEKHLMPRPKVNWPVLPAIIAHDAQVIAAGITTVLDALAVGDIDPDSLRNQSLQPCAQGLASAAAAGLLRAEHLLHLRLELAEPDLPGLLAPFMLDERLALVSLMDHTPGQRQWSDLGHYRTYVTGKRGWSHEKVDQMLAVLAERQQRHVAENRRLVVAMCGRSGRNLPLASHDDTTPEHVLEGVADGVCISEFPTTLAAARAAREHGLAVVMGAPNCVRGGSHSGNVSAAELAREGLLDMFSSDYVPSSLLQAAFMLQQYGYSLPEAIATVSATPAAAIALDDRGQIATGLRADFLRVRVHDGIPVVLGVWKSGQRVY